MIFEFSVIWVKYILSPEIVSSGNDFCFFLCRAVNTNSARPTSWKCPSGNSCTLWAYSRLWATTPLCCSAAVSLADRAQRTTPKRYASWRHDAVYRRLNATWRPWAEVVCQSLALLQSEMRGNAASTCLDWHEVTAAHHRHLTYRDIISDKYQ